MNSALQVHRDHQTRLLPRIAGSAALLMAIYQVATPGSPEASYDSFLDWGREVVFLAYLVTSVFAAAQAHRQGIAPRATAVLLAVGYGAIAVGVTVGMVMGEDPDWFMALGGPGNLLAMAAFVTWAIWGRRHRVLPTAAALLCGVGGVVAVLGAELGTSVLIAGFWFYVAQLGAQAREIRSHQTKS